jgi:tyrosine-specific transport protein
MKHAHYWHAVIMITGTSIGTGILGLPITTSQAGFWPTILMFIITWLFMTQAALYILDVKMHYRSHHTLSSLIQLTLGKIGHYSSALILIILLYALLSTYIMTGTAWLRLWLAPTFLFKFHWVAIGFVTVFGLILTMKDRRIYAINNLLGIALAIAFIIMIGLSLWPINLSLLNYTHPPAILRSMPLLLTTFGFSVVVPTITEYLDYDAGQIKSAIIVGSFLALVGYVIWEWVTLGHIPRTGTTGLNMLYRYGDNGTGVIHAFSVATGNRWATTAGQLFAIFADITSFFGIALALMHCLKEWLSLKMPPIQKHRLIMILTFFPPLCVTLFYPEAFVELLSFAGLSVALLLGLFPALMRIKLGRLKHAESSAAARLQPPIVIAIVTAVFFSFVMIIELYNLTR